MIRWKNALLILLLLQCGLLAWRLFGTEEATGPVTTRLLDGVTLDQVTKVTIEGDGKVVTLSRADKDAAYTIAELGGYPASPKKVEEILRGVMDLSVREPVTTTTEHHRDLEVGDTGWKKKITLTVGSAETTLVLGTTGKAGGVHIRKLPGDTVWAARDLDDWRLSTRPDSWIDLVLWELAEDRVSALRWNHAAGSGSASKRADGTWEVAGPDGVVVSADAEKVKEAVRKAARISFSEVAGKFAEKDWGFATPTATLTVELASAEAGQAAEVHQLSLVAQGEGGQDFWLRADGGEWIRKAGSWAVGDLATLQAASMVATVQGPESVGEPSPTAPTP